MKRTSSYKSIFFGLMILGSLSGGMLLHGQTSPVVPGQDSSSDLAIAVGKTVLLDFAQPVKRVAIGSSEIAEVRATSPNEVMVSGRGAGVTSLIVWNKAGDRQFFNVTVHSTKFEAQDKLDGVRREMARELPGQNVQLTMENGSVFLNGTVNDLASSERAEKIAATAVGDKNKVVNMLYSKVPAAEKQILLKVKFASLDRSKAKQMGINLFDLGLGGAVGSLSTGQFSTTSITGSASAGYTATQSAVTTGLLMFPGLSGAGMQIQALETAGITEVLAEPNLVAANGQQASFLAGGEYPFPIAQTSSSGSTITIQWKEYGVRLSFIPTITPRGTIKLQVAPEVSALDTANAVTVDGTTVPALTIRKVKTEAELAAGQTIVIGGLLDNRETEVFEKIPFLGDIPVLGKFFQSKEKTRKNTELIVSVTPELIDPIPAGHPVPEVNMPSPFLPANSSDPMHHPDGPTTPGVQSDVMPVEKLVESMKEEKQLEEVSASSKSSSGSSSSGASTSH